jgi:NAD-dependent DNA ligase
VNEEQMAERLFELYRLLWVYKYQYYILDDAKIPDRMFDLLEREAKQLEERLPQIKQLILESQPHWPGAPTDYVGSPRTMVVAKKQKRRRGEHEQRGSVRVVQDGMFDT